MQRTQIKRIIELGVAQVNINARDTGLALAALAQENARRRVSDAAIVAATDSSGGTADGNFNLAAVVTPSEGTVNGADTFADKAGFDTRITEVDAANAGIRDQVNAVLAALNGGADVGRQVEDNGTAGGGVTAVGGALAGATAGVVDAATGKQQLNVARNNQASLAAAVNYCRIAVGLEPMRDGSGGMFNKSITLYPQTPPSATGDGLTGSGTSLDLTTVNMALDALRNNVATMAAALNEVTEGADIGPFVVATHNPHTRFAIGNTTP